MGALALRFWYVPVIALLGWIIYTQHLQSQIKDALYDTLKHSYDTVVAVNVENAKVTVQLQKEKALEEQLTAAEVAKEHEDDKVLEQHKQVMHAQPDSAQPAGEFFDNLGDVLREGNGSNPE